MLCVTKLTKVFSNRHEENLSYLPVWNLHETRNNLLTPHQKNSSEILMVHGSCHSSDDITQTSCEHLKCFQKSSTFLNDVSRRVWGFWIRSTRSAVGPLFVEINLSDGFQQVHEILSAARLEPTTNKPFLIIWTSVWTSAVRLHHVYLNALSCYHLIGWYLH